jgi:hypothetical protein
MNRLRLLTCAGFLALGTVCLIPCIPFAVADYPKPSVVPTTWELNWRHEKLKRIVVNLPGETKPRVYWYLVFVATNNTGEDRPFLPSFDMVTRDGQVLKSNKETSAAVFDAIAKREAKTPLHRLEKLTGTILQGEDVAKYGVAIWEEPLAEMGSLNIFVGGLSGEVAKLTDSDGNEVKDASGNPILLRKTKQIDFTVRGDEVYAGDPVIQTGESWVMR